MKDIRGFTTPETRWLSNFYPVTIRYRDGITYPSSEHLYQALKTCYLPARREIAVCGSPGKAKKLGQKVTIREDWDKVKRNVMKDVLRLKFQLPGLRQALLDTGDAYLEETNWWGDTYWGVCGGKGENHLGQILMEIRDEIRSNSNIH